MRISRGIRKFLNNFSPGVTLHCDFLRSILWTRYVLKIKLSDVYNSFIGFPRVDKNLLKFLQFVRIIILLIINIIYKNKVLKSYISFTAKLLYLAFTITKMSCFLQNFQNKYVHIEKRITYYIITVCLNITSTSNTTIYKATNHLCDQLKVLKGPWWLLHLREGEILEWFITTWSWVNIRGDARVEIQHRFRIRFHDLHATVHVLQKCWHRIQNILVSRICNDIWNEINTFTVQVNDCPRFSW